MFFRNVAVVAVVVVGGSLLLATGGCASSARKAKTSGAAATAPAAAPAPTPPASASVGAKPARPQPVPEPVPQPAAGPVSEPVAPAPQAEPAKKPARIHAIGPCRDSASPGEPFIDEARRKLYETLCGAALWFDGLFGENNNFASARRTSGRLEISGLDSQYEGTKVRVRGSVRVDFPNLDNRVNAFLGRDDQDDFIRDRNEGLALRSQFLRLETSERWLAGLGYALPGSYKQRTDFRVGGRLSRTPEIFLQARHRRNWVLNERNLWHFRETVFWTNRDGFGSTTSLDFDHVVTHALLLRWGTAGTFSEATKGLDWRSALLMYQNLPKARAIGYEVFIRGESANQVPLQEWGTRVIYRQQLLHREWLAGEVVTGYSWPRFERADARKGSFAVGLGIEVLIGNWK